MAAERTGRMPVHPQLRGQDAAAHGGPPEPLGETIEAPFDQYQRYMITSAVAHAMARRRGRRACSTSAAITPISGDAPRRPIAEFLPEAADGDARRRPESDRRLRARTRRCAAGARRQLRSGLRRRRAGARARRGASHARRRDDARVAARGAARGAVRSSRSRARREVRERTSSSARAATIRASCASTANAACPISRRRAANSRAPAGTSRVAVRQPVALGADDDRQARHPGAARQPPPQMQLDRHYNERGSTTIAPPCYRYFVGATALAGRSAAAVRRVDLRRGVARRPSRPPPLDPAVSHRRSRCSRRTPPTSASRRGSSRSASTASSPTSRHIARA